jgi:hypothetical protein
MARNFSNNLKANLIRLNVNESPIVLIEISNPILTNPIRIVNDHKDVVSNNKTYTSCMIDVALPEEKDKEAPNATISIDNVSRTLTRFFEQLQGGPDTKVRFMQILRSQPNVIEYNISLDLVNVKVTPYKITGTLSYDNLLNKQSVTRVYNKINSPGLF